MSLSEDEMRAATIGPIEPLSGQILIADYDPQWPELFEAEAAKLRVALGNLAVRLEHVGSTSVPGLCAKPIIDMVLQVENSADENTYVPPVQACGHILRIREPDWYEHRMFRGPGASINLHVFSSDCPEVDRMVLFRDHLRNNPADRDFYARTKLELAQKHWKYVQNYADAKTSVIAEITSRARLQSPDPISPITNT